jgi:uncharacterized membrane protein YkvA (DUF1232 family)
MRDLWSGRRFTFWTTLQLMRQFPTFVRLLPRLLSDPQVTASTKALFLGALLFIVSPLDVPNFVPVLGEVSDLVLLLLACRWFLNLCPADRVAGHLAAIRGRAAGVPVTHPEAELLGLRPEPVDPGRTRHRS